MLEYQQHHLCKLLWYATLHFPSVFRWSSELFLLTTATQTQASTVQRRILEFSNLRDDEGSHVSASDHENKHDYSDEVQRKKLFYAFMGTFWGTYHNLVKMMRYLSEEDTFAPCHTIVTCGNTYQKPLMGWQKFLSTLWNTERLNQATAEYIRWGIK